MTDLLDLRRCPKCGTTDGIEKRQDMPYFRVMGGQHQGEYCMVCYVAWLVAQGALVRLERVTVTAAEARPLHPLPRAAAGESTLPLDLQGR